MTADSLPDTSLSSSVLANDQRSAMLSEYAHHPLEQCAPVLQPNPDLSRTMNPMLEGRMCLKIGKPILRWGED